MILSWIWVGMTAAALIFGALSGRLEAVSQAALSGAASAVELGISMAGTLCLWSGVMEILRLSGLSAGLARGFRPLLRRLFPQASRDPETLAAISANVSANLLGLGNAATPLGIRAVQRMAHGKETSAGTRKDTREDTVSDEGTASDEVCRLVVLNTASVQLIPATVAALRSAAGCAAPFDILPAVWTASILSVGAGSYLSARDCPPNAFSPVWKEKRGKDDQRTKQETEGEIDIKRIADTKGK